MVMEINIDANIKRFSFQREFNGCNHLKCFWGGQEAEKKKEPATSHPPSFVWKLTGILPHQDLDKMKQGKHDMHRIQNAQFGLDKRMNLKCIQLNTTSVDICIMKVTLTL